MNFYIKSVVNNDILKVWGTNH